MNGNVAKFPRCPAKSTFTEAFTLGFIWEDWTGALSRPALSDACCLERVTRVVINC